MRMIEKVEPGDDNAWRCYAKSARRRGWMLSGREYVHVDEVHRAAAVHRPSDVQHVYSHIHVSSPAHRAI